MDETLEDEARRLYNIFYDKAVSDDEWSKCREHWMRDIEWLRQMTIGNQPDEL